jgi:hypothetical protein
MESLDGTSADPYRILHQWQKRGVRVDFLPAIDNKETLGRKPGVDGAWAPCFRSLCSTDTCWPMPNFFDPNMAQRSEWDARDNQDGDRPLSNRLDLWIREIYAPVVKWGQANE